MDSMDSKLMPQNLCPSQAKANREVVTTPLGKLYQINLLDSTSGLSDSYRDSGLSDDMGRLGPDPRSIPKRTSRSRNGWMGPLITIVDLASRSRAPFTAKKE
jgi:hypothetical protein